MRKLIPRLSWSVIGLGWLLYGIRLRDFFLLVFLPTPSPPTREPSLIEMLLGTLLPIVGIVIVVMMNADTLAMPMTGLLRRIKSLAPISRTSLAYPLTFRFRTGVTMALLSLVVFLILLLVTNNLGAIQEAQVEQRTGNFHLLFGLVDKPDLVSDTDGDKSAGNLPVPPAYWEVIQSEMAQGLHLSRTQVQGKLRTGTNNGANLSGAAIVGIASQQGLSQDQLHNLELQALQKASDKMVSTHTWTQAQADDNMSRWRSKEPSKLNASFEEWLLGE